MGRLKGSAHRIGGTLKSLVVVPVQSYDGKLCAVSGSHSQPPTYILWPLFEVSRYHAVLTIPCPALLCQVASSCFDTSLSNLKRMVGAPSDKGLSTDLNSIDLHPGDILFKGYTRNAAKFVYGLQNEG